MTEGRPFRLLYQGLIPESGGAAHYWAARRRHLAEVAGPDVTVTWRAVDPDHYTELTPAEMARFELGESLQALAVARSVVDAVAEEPEGFDAVVIGIVQDSGLDIVRTLVDAPVVGYGQAAMLLSRGVAHRAGVLLFNPDLAPLVRERLDRYVPGHLLAVEAVDLAYDDVLGVFDQREGGTEGSARSEAAAEVSRVVEAACGRLARAGAEVVIPGQMLLAEAVRALGIRSVAGTAVLDGIAASLWLARAMAGAWAAGLRPPAHGFHWEPPPDALRRLL